MRHLFLVLLVWCAIYLPGLGALEIKGEEGRRILPAISMMQSGDYLVPRVGSDPYFNKPPLINWLVAASFKITGQRKEWSARLPSALCVLAVSLAFIFVARGALGANCSLAASLIWLTNFGLIEKGRLIEIEALYVSLCGLALICWLSWYREKRSAWLTWIVPWIFLGLGWLAKGPLHLLFFYAIVLAVLWETKNLRALWSLPHLFGVLLMLGIFAAWAVPCLLAMQNANVAQTWSRQFSGRLSGEDFHLRGWLLNIPRGLGYLLPWTFALLLLRRVKEERALAFAIGASFLFVCLLPGALARYTMPLLVPAAWLVARLLRGELRWPLLAALIASIALPIYGFALTPLQKRREKVRNIAVEINAAASAPSPIFAIDPDYQPFLFYVREPLEYRAQLSEVPSDGRYLLVQSDHAAEALASQQWAPRKVHPLLTRRDYRGKEITLLEIADGR